MTAETVAAQHRDHAEHGKTTATPSPISSEHVETAIDDSIATHARRMASRPTAHRRRGARAGPVSTSTARCDAATAVRNQVAHPERKHRNRQKQTNQNRRFISTSSVLFVFERNRNRFKSHPADSGSFQERRARSPDASGGVFLIWLSGST